MKKIFVRTLLLILPVLLSPLIDITDAAAQSPEPSASPAPSPAHSLPELRAALEKSLLAEQAAQGELQQQLKRENRQQDALEHDIKTYRIQISNSNNLLLTPTIPVNELKNAQDTLLLHIGQISAQTKELVQKRSELEQTRLELQKQYLVNEKQIAEIQAEIEENSSSDRTTETLLSDLRQLTLLLSMKQELIETMYSRYDSLIRELEQIRQDFEQLIQDFDFKISERQKHALFTRQENPLDIFGKDRLSQEFERSLQQLRKFTSLNFWVEAGKILWETEGILLLRFIAFLGLVLFLLLRLKTSFSKTLLQLDESREPWRCLLTHLLQRSLLLSGFTVSLFFYVRARPLYSPLILKGLFLPILLLILSTRWLLDTLNFWEVRSRNSPFRHLVLHERVFFRSIRYLMLMYIALAWALGGDSVILNAGRTIFAIILFLWNLLFWREYRKIPEEHFPESLRGTRRAMPAISTLGHVVASGGLLIELAGYGSLARYWYVSCWYSLIVLLWSGLIFKTLREWESTGQSEYLLDGEHKKERAAHQIRWLLVRLSWIAWPLFSLIGVLVAWGEMQTVLAVTLRILSFPLSVGGITISLLGAIYSVLILLITHVFTRFWERLLKEKILLNSALDQGVQISISTISIYLIWLFGILWALNALGIGTTSIAVAFGALGIGIGFGLQSIFNNFLSGIILLFERPIEVGDVLEVSGNWGFVEKINVRSTVIRTYDNSALIIPNSDIISNQLTNWTFKDVRVRRTIQIGVAYGSDTRLVEQCLYEIAEQHARVMTEPAPMVLFSDFGDHALIFKLRVWTLLDYGLSTETDIRFEIDSVFREKQIEIAFPQLDVHLDYANTKEDTEEKM